MSITRGSVARIGTLLLFLMIGCADSERNQPYSNADSDAAPAEGIRAGTDMGAGAGTGTAAGVGAVAEAGRGSALGTVPGGAAAESTILFVGTSLTAGLGLAREQSFPLLIQDRIDAERLPYRVVNAGVSGETSAGARSRIDWLLQQEFDVLVLEAGANDMLRGVDPATTERNIAEMIERVRSRRPEARILLVGMLALPNLGADYGERFAAVYPRLADRYGLDLVPFLLEGVAADPQLNLADGIHPNAAGHRIIAQTVWSELAPMLR